MKPQLVPPDIDVILEAMRVAIMPPTGGDPGYTTVEWAAKLGVSERHMLTILRRLHGQGKLVAGHQHRTSINGRNMLHSVYRVV